MKRTTAKQLAASAAAFMLTSLFSPTSVAGGDPPSPPPYIPVPPLPPLPDPCVDIPNPVYEACKVAVKCNTGPFGGTYCNISGASFCNRVTDPAKVAEDAAKIAAAAAVCSMVPPANAIPGKARIALAQATAACALSSAQQQPGFKDGFCGTLDSFVDICPGPRTINTCPWKN